ncbi:MAG: hypothetical protein KIY12_07710 [Thermoplasmata archaeon]|uniref:Uncharacterized protein n=1 Tax=Candidatus Sysuiplasma superficiale TaxID=2823368 RepID=A0A8J8CDI8_9ARCH|nr:hypothetical protein [Candidatus Sysuiplasma superficiale]
MPNRSKPKEEDWFKALEAELDREASSIREDVVELNRKKAEINREALQDFWRIWLRFNRSNIHFSIQPEYSEFLRFTEFPDGWQLKEDFRFSSLNSIELTDRTSEEGRMGDRLRLFYYTLEGKNYLRLTFEYFEGEHYYKYSGWKRLFGQYVLYDVSISAFNTTKFHEILADVVKAWFESHLRRSRDSFLEHLKVHYPAGTPYSE